MEGSTQDERSPSCSADCSPFDVPGSLETCSSSEVFQFSLQQDKDWRIEPYLSVPCPIKAVRLSSLLVYIHVPDSVRELPAECFHGELSLQRVTFGPSSLLESIGAFAFAVTHISEISIPNGVRHLGTGCFGRASLKHVMFGACSLDHIGTQAFCETGLTEINIPSSVRELLCNCFHKSKGLERVTFSTPSSLERIHAEVMKDTSVVEVSIPDSVRHLGYKCFFHCKKMRRVVFGISSSLTHIGVRAFEGAHVSALNIPNSVVEVSNKCFYKCKYLKRVRFGESSRLERIGTMCFAHSGLESFQMPASVM